MSLERSHEPFQTTSWTLIDAVRGEAGPERSEALSTLTERYWPPVYAHLRSRAVRPEEAAELTQAFFSDVVLGRNLFDRADARRGRLRTLLLTALDRYEIDRHRRSASRDHGMSIPLEQLPREEARLADGALDHNGNAYDRRWALADFEEALRRCEEHFRQAGKPGHWLLFEKRVLRPAISGNAPEPLATAATAAGFQSAALGAAAVQVVKQRTRAMLREVVGETVDDPAEVDAELAEIRRLLAEGE